MKKLLSLMLVLVLSVSLVACTSSESAGLYDAFKNMQEVNAIETNTDISFNLSGQGLGENETMQLNQVASIINGMKLNMKSKSVGNEEGTFAKAESRMNLNFMGMSIPIESWSEIDLDQSKMLTISRIPEMALGLMGTSMDPDAENPLAGKEYILNDMGAMMNAEGEEVDFEEMIEFQKEFQPKLIQFMEDIEKDLKLDSEIIKLEEEKEVDGEKIKVYRLHLNDESLREVVKDTVNYVLENDATKEFVVEYMNGYINTMNQMGMADEFSQEELRELEDDLEDLDENIEKIREDFNAFMDKYKDIKILGAEGINVLYSVNEDGYVVEESGIMDFSIDLAQMAKFQDVENLERDEEFEEAFPATEMKGKINLKIDFKSNNSNINSEELAVNLPEITPQNSLTMDELMEIQMEQLERQMEMMEEFEGMKIEE